jgi:asparagine synthase (glutamine-hydrolysing)
MCGIIGGLHDGSIDSRSIGMTMLESVRHRGPDAGYLHLEDRLFLGVRRLAIISPAHGSQPVRNETGNLLAVLNGEIYNHRDLRDQLTRAGHRVAPGSDAEVIPHAFEQWGWEFPKHLNGEFAIAIWDTRAQRLTLVRDRVGVKPLFYAHTRRGLVFASEAKAILTHPDVESRLNAPYFAQLFTYWAGLESESAFAGVHEVATGHVQSFDVAGKTVDCQRYWQIPYRETVAPFQGDYQACQEEFRHVLRRSVALRLQADVPVGTYTSGGVDSSVINVLAYGDLGHRETETFSVSFDDPVFDESRYQELVVNHLGLHGHQVRCSAQAIYRAMPDVIYHAESPLFRTAAAPMYLLSQRVAENGIKVVLTGEGSDEVAWGYDIFREMKIRRFWSRQPGSDIRPQLLRKLYAYLPQFQHPRHFRLLMDFFSLNMQQTDDPLYAHHMRFANSRATHPLLGQAMVQELEQRPPIESLAASLPNDFAHRSPLEKCQYVEMRTLLRGYLLSSQGDRMLSAHGVEGRFPFLDHHVIDFLASVPERFRLRGLQDKVILRDAFQQDLPAEIIRRPKFAFRAPELSAFLDDDDGFVDACMQPSAIQDAGIFDAAAVTHFLGRLRKSPTGRYSTRDNLAFVQVLSTQLLHDQFVRSGRSRRESVPPNDVVITSRCGASGRAAA